MDELITKLKTDTGLSDDIIYRSKVINNKHLTIIFNEPLVSSNTISDFIIRSLNNIKGHNLFLEITNNISSFKWIEITKYQDISFYLNFGFTIIMIHEENKIIALETKADLERSISTPDTEASIRGAKDAFLENIQINIGLIKKRIRHNDIRIKKQFVGKYTNTQVAIIAIKSICKNKLIKKVTDEISKINIDGIINGEQIKNLIDKGDFPFPTILTTERPDIASNALLQGKVVIVVDNSPYVLIVPGLFYDYFKTPEDYYTKNINVSFTRIIRYMAFFIAMLTPAIYLSFVTYNFNMVPTDLLINFQIGKQNIFIPSFFEAFIMLISFEIIREADIRIPPKLGSSFSIVGALILGNVAIDAHIIEPTMIIIIALTAISSLPFNEVDITNSLRLYRFIFMIGALFMGFIGVYIVFLIFLITVSSKDILGIPYLTPYSPLSLNDLKDSIIKIYSKVEKRNKYLSNNIIKGRR